MVEQRRSLEPPNANQIIIHYTIRRWVRSGYKTLLVPNRPIVISVYLCMCMFIRCLNVHFVCCIRLNLWGQNKHVRTNLGYRSIGFYLQFSQIPLGYIYPSHNHIQPLHPQQKRAMRRERSQGLSWPGERKKIWVPLKLNG